MSRPVLRSQLVDAVRHPTRLLLMGLAMIIAAFVVFGTVLASRIVERTLVDRLSGTPAAVDFVIGEGTGTSVQTLDAVRGVPGVAQAVARTSAAYELADQPNRGISISTDPGHGPLATVTVVQGRYPSAPNEIAVTERTVDRLGLAPGTVVRITTHRPANQQEPQQTVTLTVVGVVASPENLDEAAYTTDEYALRLSPREWLPRIDVRLASDASAGAVVDALRRVTAGAGPEHTDPSLMTGDEIRRAEVDAVSDHVESVFALVGMFVAIAVVAAALVATSTFRIVFAQRMRQLALLRAVGAGRGQLLRALVLEGTLTGVIAGGVGVLAASAAGYLAKPVFAAFGIAIVAPTVPVGWAVGVVIGAAIMTMVAVLLPAVAASRVAPLDALRTASLSSSQGGISVGRLVFGALAGVGAILLAVFAVMSLPGDDATSYDALSTLLVIVGSGALAYVFLVAVGPLLVRPVLALAGQPMRALDPIGRLAVGGVGAAPRRAAAVSVVVALGVTLIGGTLVGNASLRELVDRELAGLAPADIAVAAGAGTTLSDDVVERVRSLSQLDHVVAYRSTSDVGVTGTNLDGVVTNDLGLGELSTWDDFVACSGHLDDLGPGRAVALSFVAREAGVQPGQVLHLTRGDRSIDVQLAATLDNTPVDAGLILDPSDLDRLGLAPAPTALLADVRKDGEPARTAAVQALRGITNSSQTVVVLADERDNTSSQLNLIAAVLLALVSLTVLVAVVGVGSTTALSVVERVREAGLLRAVGLSRLRLRTMLTLEAGLYGLIGAVFGLVLAVPYSWLAVKALGANAPFEFPGIQLAVVVMALAVATAIAGLLPARRAARVSPVAALSADT